MKLDENDSSQQEQGFFKPQLKVLSSNKDELPKPKPQSFSDQANNLITYVRPTDYLPRVLLTSPPIFEQLIDLNLVVSHKRQQLIPIKQQKVKRCKYPSLKDKYKYNHLYELIYSKTECNNEFNSYLFSLSHVSDFNPNHYQPITSSTLSNKFESRFQSGNLLYAYRCLQNSQLEEYDLILQNDTNTKGYNQWFYFSFRNEQLKKVRFNIVNLVKKHSLFEEGVRPVGFSVKRSQEGWHSVGSNIDYQKSYISRQVSSNPPIYKNYYTLSFTIDFPNENDVTYIALNYPYTYSRMVKFINEISDNFANIKCQRSILAYTISNNAIPLLKLKHAECKENGKILVMGRQHPGETVGSFVLQGFLLNLLKDQAILRHYQVIVIPMVNPDGVIYGNFRTNLAGFDLNRQWIDPSKLMHPQVYYISRFIESLDNISFVIDFHGHSKKYNSFIYACTGDNPHPYRVFPYICSQQTSLFTLKDCTYSITFDKQKTARIKLFRQVKKPQIFTFQTSFFGYSDQNYKKYRYQLSDLFLIGQKISQSLKIMLFKKKELMQFEKEVREKQYLFDQWALQNKEDIESQSNPSQDQLTPLERKQKVLSERPNRKAKHKSKKHRNRQQKKSNLHSIQKDVSVDKQPLPEKVKGTLPQAVVKKKAESTRLVKFNDLKIKKKLQKPLTIISPHPPSISKHSSPNIIAANNSQTMVQNTSSTVVMKQRRKQQLKQVEPVHPSTQRQIKEEVTVESAAIAQPSNLFSNTHFYVQKTKKSQNQLLHQKTQSLQINNKRQGPFPKGNNFNLKRLISNEDQRKDTTIDIASTIRHKQRLYLRENRVVNSLTKINQDEIKRNLEQQINHRTQALRNCQKKMRQMSLEQPILQRNYQIEPPNKIFLVNATSKGYKFPNIRIDKKFDYFNF